MSNFNPINSKKGDLVKNKNFLCDSINALSKLTKAFESHDRIIKKNTKNINNCVLERKKNDKDIDMINEVLLSNKKILQSFLTKFEYLEENVNNLRRLNYMSDDEDDKAVEAKQVEEKPVEEKAVEEEETIKEE